MSIKGKRLTWIVRVGRAHKRLALSAVLGAAVIAALPVSPTWITRALIGRHAASFGATTA